MTGEWFKRWFNEDYALLYSHRDEEEAAQFVRLLFQHFPNVQTGRTLDMGCGSGRHLKALKLMGTEVIGIDYSAALLRRAKLSFPEGNFIRADMRHPPIADSTCSLVLSAFTSFGYFDSDAEHLQLLKTWAQQLLPSGLLVIDYLNPIQALTNLGTDTKSVEGRKFIQSRSLSIDRKHLLKHIQVYDDQDKLLDEFQESVRLYSRSDLEQLLLQAGFMIIKEFGDYGGAAFAPDSKRLILISKKSTVLL